MRRIAAYTILMIAVLTGTACSTVGYYSHIINGHFDLMAARAPIETVLDDENTAAAIKQRLRTALSIRQFASDELLLPNNDSYRSYADIGRNVVTWNVVATPSYSLTPESWCFWVAGCISYRGFYKKELAERFARELAKDGFDVAISGSRAYSTLGWFDDPVLNTMLTGETYDLAGVIFHELAHQQLYVDDSSAFNEAFATFVQRMGTERWLKANDPGRLASYRAKLARQRAFLNLLKNTRDSLQSLYSNSNDKAELFEGKRAIFDDLRASYQALRKQWNGYAGYDAWFDRNLNNAHLATLSTYYRWVAGFSVMFDASGSLAAFYKAVEELSKQPVEIRRKRLNALSGV